MATSDLLQKPQILEIIGSTIRIKHPDISGNYQTSVSSSIAAAGTTLNVLDTGAITGNGFADNDWYIVGAIGDSETEENDVNGAVTRGTSMTVTNVLSFGHEIDAPVTKIYERGIKIYGAATDGGTGTLIASVDAKTASGRQLADAVMIEWHRPHTEYTMISTDTAYAYYYVQFTDGTTSSSASDYVLAAGLGSTSVEYFIQQALEMTNTSLNDPGITREQCIKWANDCQTEITQYTYQDSQTGKMIAKNWDFEEAYSSGDITMTTNKNKYDLSDLSMKFPYNDGVISIQIGTMPELEKLGFNDYLKRMSNKPYTEVATQAEIGDTTLVVDSLVEFSDPDGSTATLYVLGQTLTYTDVTGTTTFTGVPASGTGSITAQIAVDSGVWQNNAPSVPTRYTIDKENLYLVEPPQSTYNNYPLNIRYFKKLTALTEASDTTVVTFTNVFQYYIASMIERRKQNVEKANELMSQWDRMMLKNALQQKTKATKSRTYYQYEDPTSHYFQKYDTDIKRYFP